MMAISPRFANLSIGIRRSILRSSSRRLLVVVPAIRTFSVTPPDASTLSSLDLPHPRHDDDDDDNDNNNNNNINEIIVNKYVASSHLNEQDQKQKKLQQHQHQQKHRHHEEPSRLPNDVQDRNALYDGEATRSMGGITSTVRHDWTKDEIGDIYRLPFHELLYRASTVHRMYWDASEVQQCTLLSIKTGGCTEDCSYCSQSTRYRTFVKPTPTMKVHEVLESARLAKEAGSTRFCMGAAWRELGNKTNAFGHILEMVRGVNAMGLEVCCTLGMVTADQARRLKEAGLTAYNHNLDTSPEHYPNVITTRSYEDRLNTISNVRDAGISVCCGGILGLGEAETDRIGLLHVLATLPDHPESVPINALVSVTGTPLGDRNEDDIDQVDAFDMARMIATARIVMPRTMVRLSAGRLSFSDAEQFMMFHAGANSIFNGDKLLTTDNPAFEKDEGLFRKLGLRGKPAHKGPLLSPMEQTGEVVIMSKVSPTTSTTTDASTDEQQQYA